MPTRQKIALLVASVCAMALFGSASPAFASAGPVCGTGSSGGNVNTCFTVTGTSLFVSQMLATATVNNSARTLLVCIHGPDSALPMCTAEVSIPAGGMLSKLWNPNRNVNAGNYCARTWRVNSDGSLTLIGEECIDVHS